MRKFFLLCSVLFLLLAFAPPAGASATIVEAFTPPNLPEGLAIDVRGNTYVGFAFTGRVLRIAPDGTETTAANLAPGSGFMTGLATDATGNVYAALASFDASTSGVWKIGTDGAVARIAALPANALPNGFAFDRRGELFVSDSFRGSVWRIGRDGTVREWLSDPSLLGSTQTCGGNSLPVGINGIAFDVHGDLLALNDTHGTLLRFPVSHDGTPGAPEILHGECALTGADGIALDNGGNFYVALNVQDEVVRVTPSGSIETLATHADGLDFPASLAFGTGRGERKTLYITSFAFARFSGAESGQPQPSLDKVDVGVPGRPLP